MGIVYSVPEPAEGSTQNKKGMIPVPDSKSSTCPVPCPFIPYYSPVHVSSHTYIA